MSYPTKLVLCFHLLCVTPCVFGQTPTYVIDRFKPNLNVFIPDSINSDIAFEYFTIQGSEVTDSTWSIFLEKINPFGFTEWFVSIPGTYRRFQYSPQKTNDGGYIILGFNDFFEAQITGTIADSVHYIKLNDSGGVERNIILECDPSIIYSPINVTDDGGYIRIHSLETEYQYISADADSVSQVWNLQVQLQMISTANILEDLSRPRPLVTLVCARPLDLLMDIQGELQNQGYIVDSISGNYLELEAILQVSSNATEYDKFLLWFERDPQQPEERLLLYVLHGKYKSYFGYEEEFQRVEVTEESEAEQLQIIIDVVEDCSE